MHIVQHNSNIIVPRERPKKSHRERLLCVVTVLSFFGYVGDCIRFRRTLPILSVRPRSWERVKFWYPNHMTHPWKKGRNVLTYINIYSALQNKQSKYRFLSFSRMTGTQQGVKSNHRYRISFNEIRALTQ